MTTAVRWEQQTLPPISHPDFLTRRQAERRAEPYRSSIPAQIAGLGIELDGDRLAAADDASRAITRFDASYATFPVPFSAVLLRSESASSSQIEHLTAGARSIAEAEIDERATGNGPLIVRNVRAMEAAIAMADEISDRTVIEMHRQLLGDTTPDLVGRYRAEQVWIGGRFPHDAEFVPPHQDRVPAAMRDLFRFTARTDVPVLVQTAIAHAQFETIHPFPDGNGRTGRALVQAMLRRGDLLRHLTVPVSSGILTDVDAYFDALTVYRDGDVGPIVDVFTDATLAALANADELAAELAALQRRWDERMAGLRSDATARSIARASIEHPVLSAKTASAATGASAPVISNAFAQLVDRGVLRQANSKQRNRVWINDEVIDALDAFAARSGRRQRP